ncbi:MAG: UDP-N-acetylmuramoyl-tripeptide--D-alanyl-D-alanine ligase [Gammaproteobacteria bacterium]|nr:UDP-N-acetylmuramoyl-tripeptide--D-alanyl-D-alanine ligase [Gammaproteobacteria bacterium]
MMQLAQVAAAVNGELSGVNIMVEGVSIDSRRDCAERLFVALDGERFDAHDFIGQAQANGATAALVEKPVDIRLPMVRVDDSHQALQDLAAWWRAQFALPVVAITGSVGKTSVKEMVGCIFAEIGRGLVTQGNLNNEIGLPLTILRLSRDDTYAVVEMGMNHAGEISRLTHIAQPTVALVNNASAAHLEGLGSIAAVAKAKGEIFEGLSADGVAVINADDKYAPLWRQMNTGREVVSFGLTESADVSATYQLSGHDLVMQVKTNKESFNIELPLVGKHNVMNILAAIAVAQAANIASDAIVAGLTNYRPVAGRFNVSVIGDITLIDDTYNANPASMRAAIEALAQFSDTTLILGDMAELGEASEREHLRLGELASENDINRLYAVGQYAAQIVDRFAGASRVFKEQAELLTFLSTNPPNSGAVLIKGSRSTQMEIVVEHLLKTYSAQGAESLPRDAQQGRV